jgi:hypothetical protein
MNFSEKAYRVLVKAYPSHYRARYAEPMEQIFRDRLREKRTFPGRALLWMRTLADWAVSVPARYWEGPTPHVPQLSLLDSGRRCLFFARSEASSFSRNEITLEHLLLGILRQEPSLVADSEAVIRAIEAQEPAGRRIPPMEDLRLSGQTVRVWVGAQEFARAAGRHVTPKDLVEGILREPESLAARLLREHSRG